MITPESLMSLEQYSKARKEFRAKVLAHKKHRTIQLGDHIGNNRGRHGSSSQRRAAMQHQDTVYWLALETITVLQQAIANIAPKHLTGRG